MTIDPITRNKIKNVVFTATEPTSTSVLWAKPDGDKVTMYVFKNGSWVDIKEAGIDPIVQAYIDSQDAATLTSAKEYTDSSVTTLEEKVDKKVGAVEIKKNDDSDLQYTLYVDGVAQGAIIIPKDQFLKEVSYNSSTKKLHFVFETSIGEKLTDIDVSDLVDTYTAGNGLSVSNNKFSVVVSADSDSYLTVTEKGIKLSGITSALANKADKTSIPTKVSQLTNDSNYVTTTTAESTYAKATDLTTEITRAKGVEDTKINKAGDTMTGSLTAPSFQTGTASTNYFQCQKFRGQGDASSYYHAIDFGYASHNQVDFYEYGAIWNFRQCTSGTSSNAPIVGTINANGWNGGAVLTGTPTAPTASAGTNTTQIATTAFVTTADTSVLASAKSYTDTSISNSVLTKAGTAYDETKEYHLHDYIIIDNSVMYICRRVDATTMVCVGHPLTDEQWWDKSIDLSNVEGDVTKVVEEYVDDKVTTTVTSQFNSLIWRGTLAEYNALEDYTQFQLYVIVEEDA